MLTVSCRPAMRGHAAGLLLAMALANPVGVSAQAAQPSGGFVLNATTQAYHHTAAEGHREHSWSPMRPPREGRYVYGHWTPYFPPDPATIPADVDRHVIQKGETLWDIAAQAYGDPLLWPYLWETNPWITYPHWIYPGDTLVISPFQVLPSGELAGRFGLDGIDDGFRRAAGQYEMNCGMFIADLNRKHFGEIVDQYVDPPGLTVTLGAIVYLNVGSKDGVLPGDEFAVVTPQRRFHVSREAERHSKKVVRHPLTNKKLGVLWKMTGRVKVILLDEEVSTARVVYGCNEIEMGSAIIPFTETAIPIVKRKEHREEFYNELRERGRGYVVYAQDWTVGGTVGTLVSIDLGADQGIVPGDVFHIARPFEHPYRDTELDRWGSWWDGKAAKRRLKKKRDPTERGVMGREREIVNTPPRVFGEAIVLYTEADTATAVISYSDREVYAGDMLVYQPVDTGLDAVATFQAPGVYEGYPLHRQTVPPPADDGDGDWPPAKGRRWRPQP